MRQQPGRVQSLEQRHPTGSLTGTASVGVRGLECARELRSYSAKPSNPRAASSYRNTGKHLGVAVSDSPTGPFRDALGKPLVRAGTYPGQAIDPMVFTDDDGRSYLYWGNGAAHVVPLNADMTSFAPAAVRTFTPDGFREGAFLFERAGTYYFMWSENDTRDENYQVAYATGPSPLGPFTKRGVVLRKRLDLGIKGTGHHSVVKAPGSDTWYIAYHRFAVPAGNGTNREVTVDRMTFAADGSIEHVEPTL
ncbi:family 43 glycosylhydrolase [Streptomyces sp. NPDC006617]|uniref:family 43 glycosylhydrolase n=1 Tax=Streptomyces sp. NPDC006617 TaxID=3155354 RepID=UPI0033B40A40